MVALCRLLVIRSVLSLACILVSASSAFAATRMYHGKIRIVLSTGATGSYSIPFGNAISYPALNNLPAGNLATISGSAPAAIRLGADQMTLDTSLFSPSPPSSWNVTEALSRFTGGHASGSFFESGAPGAGSSAPVSGLGASQFGVTFKGAPARFGGTLRLLGQSRTRWGGVYSPNSHYCAGFSIGVEVDCSVWKRPLSPIGGPFGGSASARASIVPGAQTPTVFDVTVWGFPWETGTVTARAPWGLGGTNSLVFKGTDQRTPQGAGNIQLVTPFVIRYTTDRFGLPPTTGYQAGIAIADLVFVPEPTSSLMLGCGFVALFALVSYSKRAS